MKKMMIIMGIMMMGFTLSACSGNSGDKTPPAFISVTIDSSNPVEADSLKTFYKGKDSNINIGIQLSNKSNFEIYSIVVNGKNYYSRNYNDESTFAYINFDMSSGFVLGETVYSVDEIIYKDGDKIDNEFIEEDNEFKIYVYKEVPIVERENYSLTRDSVSVDFDIEDYDDVIVSNSLVAQLFSGETKVDEKLLSVGQSNVTFTSLLANKNYEIKVKANYDLDDSLGLSTNVALYSGSFSTIANALPSASIKNFLVTSNSITFDVQYNDNDLVTFDGGISVKVFDGNTLVRQTQITGTVANVSFEGLLNDNDYTLQVYSDYNLRDGHGVLIDNVLATQVFSTLPRLAPLPTLANLIIEENRILFDLEIEDPNSSIYKDTLVAKIYIDGALVEETKLYIDDGSGQESNMLEYKVDFQLYNLLSNLDLLFEIEASYDLNDGRGIQTEQVILTQPLKTLFNEVPSVSVTEISVTQGYITIDLAAIDIDDTLRSPLTLVLYENDISVTTLDFGLDDTEIILNYPVKNVNSYSMEIIADFNLREGNENISEYALFTNLPISFGNTKPAAELSNFVFTNNSITLDINFMDIDETVEAGSMIVRLALEGVEVTSSLLNFGENSVVFTNLLSNNPYEISVTANYDLQDGANMQYKQVLITDTFEPLAKVIPEAMISNIVEENTKIMFDVSVDDDTGAITGNLKAVLYEIDLDLISGETFPGWDVYEGESTFIQEINLTPGTDSYQFSELDFGTGYVIIIETNYNLNDGDASIIGFELDNALASTYQVIVVDDADVDEQKRKVIFEFSTDDIFDILRSDSVEIQLYNASDIPVGENMTITKESGVPLLSLHSDADYYVLFSPTYDVGSGIVTDVVFRYDFHTLELNLDFVVIDRDTIDFDETTIYFDVVYEDDEDSVLVGEVKAYIYENGDESNIIDEITIDPGTDSYQVDGLDTVNNGYQILIRADADVNDGNGITILYVFDEVTPIIQDYTPPTFDSIDDQIIESGGADIDWTYLITNGDDNRDVMYLTTIEYIDNVDYDTPGTYTVTVQLVDGAWNRTSEEFEVEVEDTITPTFVITDQTIEAGPFTTSDLVTTSVVENSDVLIYSEIGAQVDYDTPGTYSVTVRLTDGAGNYSEQEVTITVEDTTGPTFDVILEQTIDFGESDIDWTDFIENELDNSDGALTLVEVTDNVDYDTAGTYTVTVKVVDEALNETLQEFNVVVSEE